MQNEVIEEKGFTSLQNAFKPRSWLTKIDFINHLVLFNNVLMVIVAEQGSGKSTFVNLLRTGLDTNIKSHMMKAVIPFDQAAFLSELHSVFHLRNDNHPTIASLVHQINERRAHTLVIIDDAQHVPDTFLKEILFALKDQETNSFFHICLASDFSLVASLNKLENELFNNLIHTIEPGALTESEMKTYLLKYLPSPKRLDKTMTDKRLEQFYQLTGGNIARINELMLNYFSPDMFKPAAKRKLISKRMGVAASVAVVLFASAYVWQNQSLLNSLTPQKKASAVVAALDIKLPDVQRETVLTEQKLISNIPAFYVAATHEPVQPPPLNRIIDIAHDEDETDDSLVVMDKVVVIPKILSTDINKLPAPVVAIQEPTQSMVKTKIQQAAVTTIPAIPMLVKSNSGKGLYTIQLIASSNQVDIKRFVDHHHAINGTKMRQTKIHGTDWYVLTMGEYNQLDQARAAIRNLPGELAQFKPWIRPLAGLNEAIG